MPGDIPDPESLTPGGGSAVSTGRRQGLDPEMLAQFTRERLSSTGR